MELYLLGPADGVSESEAIVRNIVNFEYEGDIVWDKTGTLPQFPSKPLRVQGHK